MGAVQRGNRAVDLVVKASNFTLASLDRDWVIDTAERSLDVFSREGNTYAFTQPVVGGQPAIVDLGIAQVVINLDALLA